MIMRTIVITESQLKKLMEDSSEMNYPKMEDRFNTFLTRLSKGELENSFYTLRNHPMMGKVINVYVTVNWDEIRPSDYNYIEEYLERKYSKYIREFLDIPTYRVLFEVN